MAKAMFANQYTITFAPEPKTDATHPYYKYNLDALQNAMNDLTKVGSMKLWLYLSLHSDMPSLGLSQKACEEWGLKKDSYQSAKKELIDKGYLVAVGKDQYEFKQVPLPMVSLPVAVTVEQSQAQKWDF